MPLETDWFPIGQLDRCLAGFDSSILQIQRLQSTYHLVVREGQQSSLVLCPTKYLPDSGEYFAMKGETKYRHRVTRVLVLNRTIGGSPDGKLSQAADR